tara:strand:- start:185 stop:388 length:204 start_codon:yes stop_codon:yes gene_type:complete
MLAVVVEVPYLHVMDGIQIMELVEQVEVEMVVKIHQEHLAFLLLVAVVVEQEVNLMLLVATVVPVSL